MSPSKSSPVADPSADVYPPHLTAEHQEHLLTVFKDYCLSHGLTVRPPPTHTHDPHNSLALHAPISLYPTAFPQQCFAAARAVQPSYNALYARIASTPSFLAPLTDHLAKVDEFIHGLYTLYTQLPTPPAQPLSLGLFRSDYLVHARARAAPAVLQVEFNTVAASFGGLASGVSRLHRHLAASGAYGAGAPRVESIPENPAAEALAAGLAAAHEAYGAPAGKRAKAVLFVVQAGERNVFDQRWLEYRLLERHGVRSFRVTLEGCLQRTRREQGERLVFVAATGEEVEVSTVYFRAGYGPEDYPTQREWDARLHLERSRAVKCPTVATQLAGSKKVQQVLAMPGELERFVQDPEECERIRATFAGIWPMDESPAGLEARRLAFEEPARFVLKPQREGGGNNVYRENIPPFLEKIGRDKWSGYILMELIIPPAAEGVIVRNGECVRGGVVSELGVYGTVLWRADEILLNKEAGWLLRTKGVESDEGGVAAGFGCVDGVCLV